MRYLVTDADYQGGKCDVIPVETFTYEVNIESIERYRGDTILIDIHALSSIEDYNTLRSRCEGYGVSVNPVGLEDNKIVGIDGFPFSNIIASLVESGEQLNTRDILITSRELNFLTCMECYSLERFVEELFGDTGLRGNPENVFLDVESYFTEADYYRLKIQLAAKRIHLFLAEVGVELGAHVLTLVDDRDYFRANFSFQDLMQDSADTRKEQDDV